MASIRFFTESTNFKISSPRKTRAWIRAVAKIEKRAISEINYIFCSDTYLLELNQRFLKHNTLTDIITFDNTEEGKDINGEIYISIDRVKENSKNLGTLFQEELHRVIFHGALHLCGFKDKTRQQKVIMRNKEEQNLDAYFK